MLKKCSLFALSIIPSFCIAGTLSCGSTIVTASDAASAKEPFFTIIIKGEAINKTYNFEIQKDFLYLRCEKTTTGKSVLLINHFCGGSGCADFGNFGIIEVNTGSMLLEPNQPFKGNTENAKSIMGKDLKTFTCEKISEEICLHTLIELG